MEQNELDLIARLSPEHSELRHLWSQHTKLQEELSKLESVRFPNESDRREISRLKRLKLRGKDRIQQILSQHRALA